MFLLRGTPVPRSNSTLRPRDNVATALEPLSGASFIRLFVFISMARVWPRHASRTSGSHAWQCRRHGGNVLVDRRADGLDVRFTLDRALQVALTLQVGVEESLRGVGLCEPFREQHDVEVVSGRDARQDMGRRPSRCRETTERSLAPIILFLSWSTGRPVPRPGSRSSSIHGG